MIKLIIINSMPNILNSIVVKRFLAHVLEISTTFAITIILLQVLTFVNNFMLGNGDFITILTNSTPSLGTLNSADYTNQTTETISQLIIGFAIFYFIYTSFNFFFTFSFLYPKNDFQANFFQRMFGFKRYEFGKKKLTHLQKAIQMLVRETILFISIYGFFAGLAIFKLKEFFDLFNFLTQSSSSFQNIFFSLLALFIVFVLPSVLLSTFSIYKTKGKQLFWDYASSVTLK
jgi:hypothetical protein